MDDLESRFWTRVDRSGGPEACWPWIGATRNGYGRFWVGRRAFTAHRWILGHLRGRHLELYPTGTEDACHRCDTPPCCNPAHLYVGTRKRNVRDAVERSRLWQLRKDHCPAGHPYDAVRANGARRGARRCYTCERANDRRKAKRNHCKSGHPLAGDNLLLCKNGTRKCRTCDRKRVHGIFA